MKIVFYTIVFSSIVFASCNFPNPNVDAEGHDQLKSLEVNHPIDKKEMEYQDILYVPIYSDIYMDVSNQNTLLAATLSIRNTSYNDSLFISKIDYFNTQGDMVRNYIKNPISIPPMGTVNYVVEKEDDSGGPGANFIVVMNARNPNIKPVVQAVMIGQNGNKGFAFATDAYSIKE